jgi:hypothetical protein
MSMKLLELLMVFIFLINFIFLNLFIKNFILIEKGNDINDEL